jgi:protein SCO1
MMPSAGLSPPALRRRHLLGWLAASGLPAHAHDRLGRLTPPLPAPAVTLRLHNGESRPLPLLLRGRITALQLMFTGCSAVCPIQGAVFATLQHQVAAPLPEALLLSISLDPVADDPAALAAWRQRHAAGERWLAGAPPVAQADRMPDFVNSRSPGRGMAADRHSPQTWLFDRQGRLAYRLAELASAADIARAMVELGRSG